MKILRAFKTELQPNNKQHTALMRHCGAARFVYNWGLARKIEAFKAHREDKNVKMPSAMTLAKELRAVRAEVAPWLSEHSSYCIDSILPHCDTAFENFFRRCKRGQKGKKGFPRFKSRKKGIGSMRFHKAYKVEEARVYFPKIGWVRLKESGYIPITATEGAKFYSATVSEKAGRWFVSVQVETNVPEPKSRETRAVVGVDFGIKTLATCSDGRQFENPKTLARNLKKLKRLQRALSRKIEAAKKAQRPLRECRNFQKNKTRVACLHARIANIRSNTLHNLSHRLTKTKRAVVIEDLNVAGMMKNRHLARAIADCGFGELRRQLEYKGAWRGCAVQVVSRWFPSSKTCSACGAINDALTLSVRRWTCACGAAHDRDLNAAQNLAAQFGKEEATRGDGAKTPASRRPKKDVAGAASDTRNARRGGRTGKAASPVPAVDARTGQYLLFEGV